MGMGFRTVALCLALVGAPVSVMAEEATGRFRVVGMAMISVPAELAEISIGVETKSDVLGEAVASNSVTMKEVIGQIRAAGVAEGDIRTTRFRIYEPSGSHRDEDEPPPPRYGVSNTLLVTVRELDALGAILTAVSSSGANDINSLSFRVDDPTPHIAEARRRSVKDARDKAALYAEASGVTLGRLVDFTEGDSLLGGMFDEEVVMMEPSSDGVPNVSIAAADVEFDDAVTLVYEIAE